MPKLDTNKIMKILQRDLKAAVKVVLGEYDIKANSDLAKSVELISDGSSFGIFINSYIKFIESGRRRFARRIPIQYVLEFLRHNKITSSEGLSRNRLAYVIQDSIYRNGVKSKRGITNDIEKVSLDVVIENITKYVDFTVEKNKIKLK